MVGVLPLFRDAVSEFYSPSRLVSLSVCLSLSLSLYIYIYIYIYVYVCVCVCVCKLFARAGYDTKSFLKKGLTLWNLEFSFA